MKIFKKDSGGDFVYCHNRGLQTIATKYLGPTDTKGARIKAVACRGETITIDWNHSEDVKVNHDRAALQLVEKLGWLELAGLDYLAGGSTRNGYVYVPVRDS